MLPVLLSFCWTGAPLVDCAIHFYKALKVYPQPKDLIHIYDSAVPKDVLEVLAEMVARDDSLKIGGSFTKGPAASAEAAAAEVAAAMAAGEEGEGAGASVE